MTETEQLLTWLAVGAAAVAAALAVALIVGVMKLQKARADAALKAAAAAERIRALEVAASAVGPLQEERDRLTADSSDHRAKAAAESARAFELSASLDRLAAERTDLSSRLDEAARALERLRAESEARERQIAELKEAREQMRQAFAENAGALMQKNSETFKAQNKEQIEHLLAPLKNDIDAFKRTLGEAHLRAVEQHGNLQSHIEQLNLRSAEVSKETIALTRALKGDVQVQGAWGEMVLDTLLKRLGFEEGVQYTRQETFSDAEGRVRTDYIVHLPQSEPLIIDSKVSLSDFEAYVNAADDATRAERLAAHARSMRAHVKGLAARNYPKKVGTRLDFVVMFVPIEGALGAAMKHDEALCLDALDDRVVLATPTTLATQLRTVNAIWNVERQHKNAEEIARRAGALYDKFAGFVDDMLSVGQRLGQLDAAYQGAMKKLSTGGGNLVRQVEMLRELGAASTKRIARDVADDAAEGSQRALLPSIEGANLGAKAAE
ncbi:MAG: DNA recombination protein RmuC [Parvularculaceae bacterium]|nr:DNA recombination protein RmuC [Parvularculaceae bacterium]